MQRKSIYWLVPVLLTIACNNAYTTKEFDVSSADSTSFANDLTPLNSKSRKLIRTADIRCRVEDVYKATTRLEQLAKNLDGAVTESHIVNEPSQLKEFSYKADSLKRVQVYVPTAYLTLKVPSERLDSIVGQISGSAQFINYRTLKQEDVTFCYLSNALKNEAAESKPDIAPAHTPKKSLEAVKYKDNRKEDVIERRVDNLRLLDDAEFSTFTVQLFQTEVSDVVIVEDMSHATRAGFGMAAVTSLRNGAELLRGIVLFLVEIWPLYLLGILVWVGYKKISVSLPGKQEVQAKP